MTQEALKLALEAHKKNERHNTVAETRYWCDQYKLLAEQALARPEQEPVKYSDYEPDGVHHTTPPQRTWVGLTDEEYTHITDTVFHTGQGLVAYYKAIEAKLKEKNT